MAERRVICNFGNKRIFFGSLIQSISNEQTNSSLVAIITSECVE